MLHSVKQKGFSMKREMHYLLDENRESALLFDVIYEKGRTHMLPMQSLTITNNVTLRESLLLLPVICDPDSSLFPSVKLDLLS